MRRVLQNLIIAFTVIFLFTGMFLYRKSEYVEASGQYTSNITAKPAVTVQVSGTSDLAGKFAGHFSGRITDGTEAVIYLEEDMTLGVSSNVIDD